MRVVIAAPPFTRPLGCLRAGIAPVGSTARSALGAPQPHHAMIDRSGPAARELDSGPMVLSPPLVGLRRARSPW